MRWLRRGVRTSLLRGLLPRHFDPGATFDIELFGYSYSGSLANWIDWNLYFFGGYEEEMQQLIRMLGAADTAGVFVDIGANTGVHSLFASRLFRKVHAFEPFPPVRNRLLATLARTPVENIEVHAVGLGAVDGYGAFFAPPSENLGTGSFVGDHSSQNTRYHDLQIREGDRYLDKRVGAVDVIKLDVEGFEIEVLRGMRQTLAAACRPDLVMEISDVTWRQLKSVAGLENLLPRDYKIFNIESRQVRAWLLERSSLRLEPVGQDRPSSNILAVGAERLDPLRLHGLVA